MVGICIRRLQFRILAQNRAPNMVGIVIRALHFRILDQKVCLTLSDFGSIAIFRHVSVRPRAIGLAARICVDLHYKANHP